MQFTWQDVEERLVDAMRHWRRSPDSEARFSLGGRISSVWRHAFHDRMALIDQLDMEAPEPRPLPLSRADIARMTEAAEWLVHVPERDRRLVVMGIAKLASGAATIPWLQMRRQLGVTFGADGLRKRYSRGITCIANALNDQAAAEKREGGKSRVQETPRSKNGLSAAQPD